MGELTIQQKAARFDALMLDALFNWEHWSKLAHDARNTTLMPSGNNPPSTGYYEAKAQTWAAVLYYAGVKPECKCSLCTEERMQAKEAIAAHLSEGRG